LKKFLNTPVSSQKHAHGRQQSPHERDEITEKRFQPTESNQHKSVSDKKADVSDDKTERLTMNQIQDSPENTGAIGHQLEDKPSTDHPRQHKHCHNDTFDFKVSKFDGLESLNVKKVDSEG
jgi:hypothetical protein